MHYFNHPPATNMVIKREAIEEETQPNLQKKRKISMEDRFSTLPDSLQLHILSFLDTKHAVQTSIQLRALNRSWTPMPVLRLNSCMFKKLHAFDSFVHNLLSIRDPSSKLESLTFNRRGASSVRILKKVQDYAFSHGVQEMEISIQRSRSETWPTFGSSDSLTSLKLQSQGLVGWPKFGSLENLTVLYLKRMLITDVDPFSRFPKLEKLTLDHCRLVTNGNPLKINATQLSDLTILSHDHYFQCYELATPKLRFFAYRGFGFPSLKTRDGLPILDTAIVDLCGVFCRTRRKQLFNDLLVLFRTLQNAKSLRLSSSVIKILFLFAYELVKRDSPFRDLKSLKLGVKCLKTQKVSEVQAYLL